MSAALSFRVATQNVCDFGASDLSEGESYTLIRRVMKTLGAGGVAGLQEIGSVEHKNAARRAAKDAGWGITFGGRADRAIDAPIVWDDAVWGLVESGRERMHEGLPPYPNGKPSHGPARWLVWAVLKHRVTGVLLPVVNVHPVAGAWNSKAQYRDDLRKKHWLEAQQVIQSRVEVLVAEYRRAVLVGDLNRRQGHPAGWAVPNGHAGLSVKAATKSAPMAIDHIYLIAASPRTWAHGRLHTEKTPSDHALRWVEVSLAPAKAKPTPPTPPTEPEEPAMSKTITDRVVETARKKYGLTVYTRDQWGSTEEAVYAARRRSKPVKKGPSDTVWQHISVTHRTGIKADMRTLERIGMDRFGSGVSYNFAVDMVTGEVGVGQPLDAKGTHTINNKNLKGFSYDQNYVSRAIVVIGMPGDRLSDKAKRAIAGLQAAMMDEGDLTDHYDYMPHSAATAKDCPCDATRDAMPEMRRMAFAMRKQANSPKPEPKPEPVPTVVEQARKDLTQAGRLINRALKTLPKE